jgi:hypothetical protein
MTTVVTALAPGTRRGFELLLIALSVGISTGAYALVGLAVGGALPVRLLAVSGGLLGLGLLLHVVIRVVAPYADPVMVPIALLINGLGLVMIHRLDLAEDPATSLAVRQLGASAISIVAAAVVLVVLRDHRRLRARTYTAMVVGLVLLLLPLAPVIGRTVNGATIWIDLGVTTFQPAELGKIAIVVFFAGYLVVARDTLSLVGPRILWLRLPRARDLGPIIVAWAASVGILVFERDLGTSLLFFGIFVAMLYVATERVSWIVIGLGLFAAGAWSRGGSSTTSSSGSRPGSTPSTRAHRGARRLVPGGPGAVRDGRRRAPRHRSRAGQPRDRPLRGERLHRRCARGGARPGRAVRDLHALRDPRAAGYPHRDRRARRLRQAAGVRAVVRHRHAGVRRRRRRHPGDPADRS